MMIMNNFRPPPCSTNCHLLERVLNEVCMMVHLGRVALTHLNEGESIKYLVLYRPVELEEPPGALA